MHERCQDQRACWGSVRDKWNQRQLDIFGKRNQHPRSMFQNWASNMRKVHAASFIKITLEDTSGAFRTVAIKKKKNLDNKKSTNWALDYNSQNLTHRRLFPHKVSRPRGALFRPTEILVLMDSILTYFKGICFLCPQYCLCEEVLQA